VARVERDGDEERHALRLLGRAIVERGGGKGNQNQRCERRDL
jgi:hypothetical protein